MKLISTLLNRSRQFTLVILITSTFFSKEISAQVCSDAANVIYGLTNSGFIYPITISNANVGSVVNPPYAGNAPNYANGIGYNKLNGKFYYFKRNAGVSAPQEFVSFDPLTNLVTILRSCPTTKNFNTGCVSLDGTGYYCLDVESNLYYYNIPTNTWVLLNSALYDQFGSNLTSIILGHSSGDIAIDGVGNLWILCSNSSEYGVYKISAPLPVNPIGILTARQIIAPTTSTPNGSGFCGIAFTSTGQIIISTSNGDNQLYRLENNLSLTSLGTLNVDGVGADLTSCSFPLRALPVIWEKFSAVLEADHHVLLTWTVGQQLDNKAYSIEHSIDGRNWEEIGVVQNKADHITSVSYSFTHANTANGNHFYRIRQVDNNGNSTFSEIKMVTIKSNSQVALWPNPAKEVVHIQIANSSPVNGFKAQLFDLSGRVVNESILQPGMNNVNINSLPMGTYIMRVQLSNGEVYNQKLIKQ